jgi:hypothetical protein
VLDISEPNTATASHAALAEPAHRPWNERIIAIGRLDDPERLTRTWLTVENAS